MVLQQLSRDRLLLGRRKCLPQVFVQYCQNPKHTVSRALSERNLLPETDSGNIKAIMM